MNIRELPLPGPYRDFLEAQGISSLYPPQEDCIKAGLLEGNSLLVAIPTASGKTLVAEMAMQQHAAAGGKCLYIVPLKALASEKFAEFSGKGPKVAISTGDYDRRETGLGRADIIIATSEKVDSLLRNRAPWLSEITLLVLDEVHLIDSPDRGATLEMVITKLRRQNPEMQIIALSATIGNPDLLSGWLGAELITSSWRPVELKEGVYYRGAIDFGDSSRELKTPTKNDDTNLCLDAVAKGGQCLVFVSSRRNAEGFAKRAASALKCENEVLEGMKKRLEAAAATDMGRTLASCAAKGAAFHHAGLSRVQRGIVEEGFREGHLKVIASTPTLAAGLNLPARRVIVRDYLRFSAGEGMKPIPVREYRQMAGRAGRPHLDPYGEAVLIARSEESSEELFEEYITAPDEEIRSRCDNDAVISAQILSLIATGFAREREDLEDFLKGTLWVYEHGTLRILKKAVDKALSFLEGTEMITSLDGRLEATEYGHLVSRLYLNPESAEMIATSLAEHGEFSEAGFLQLLCATPDMFCLYAKKQDLPRIEKYFYLHEEELWAEFSYDRMEDFFRSLKTAMLLEEWITETGEETICERFGVGPGDVHGAVDGVLWLAHAATRLSDLLAPHHKKAAAAMEIRLRHGVKKELLPLIALRGIGRVRARRLFNANITSVEALRSAGEEKTAALLGKKIAGDVFAQLEGRRGGAAGPRAEDEDNDRFSQATLAVFHKKEGAK